MSRFERWFDRMLLNERFAARWHMVHAGVNIAAIIVNIGAAVYHAGWAVRRHLRDQK